jgi:HlyD family secretion protein
MRHLYNHGYMHYQTVFISVVSIWLLFGCGKPSVENDNAKDPLAIRADTPLVVREVIGLARVEPPEKIITLNAESAGYLRELYISDGQRVKKGEVIARLDYQLEKAQLEQAKSKLQTQRDAVAVAEANLTVLQAKSENAQNTLERNRRLATGNATTIQQLDESRFALGEIAAQINAQRADIAKEQSRLRELEADVQYQQTVLNQRNLTAPMDGIFLKVDIKPGQFVSNNSALGAFAVDGPYLAVTEVDELFADRIQAGQKAFVRMQGGSDTLATGTVVFASPFLQRKSLFSDSPDNLEDRRVREVHIRLDANDRVLIGARVESIIAVGPR